MPSILISILIHSFAGANQYPNTTVRRSVTAFLNIFYSSLVLNLSAEITQHKKWSFPLRISSVNVTKSCYLYATRTIEANQVGEESGCVRTLPYQQYEEKVFQINMEK